MELILVMAILSILSMSAGPYMLKTFSGFSDICEQQILVDKLHLCSVVITRRIVFNNESADKANLEKIVKDIVDTGEVKVDSVKQLKTGLTQIVLKSSSTTDNIGSTKLSFVVYPAY